MFISLLSFFFKFTEEPESTLDLELMVSALDSEPALVKSTPPTEQPRPESSLMCPLTQPPPTPPTPTLPQLSIPPPTITSNKLANEQSKRI